MNRQFKTVSMLLLLAQASMGTAYASANFDVNDVRITQQSETCTGIVKDASGETVIGASVVVKGTTNGSITDFDGKFSLSNVKVGDIIQISFVGYKTEELKWNGKSMSVVLKEDTEVLEEVVVTALGIKRQSRELGYSTTKVGGEEFALARDPNVGNALSGKVAGVSVAGNATGSGGSSRVVIRGNASLTGNNMPLYVVDGVPFDNSNQGSAGTWGGKDMGDGLNNINADDIESIQVLKGAAASALYGYRGGNGAILITTKSGKKGKGTVVEFNNNLTFNMIYDQRDFQKVFGQGKDGKRPMDIQAAKDSEQSNWGEVMDGGKAINFLGNEYAYSYVDNWDNFYRTGITNNTSVSVSGADEKVAYRVGATYSLDRGILPNAKNDQKGLNLNTTYNITKNLQLGINANYIFEKANGRSGLSDGNGNTNASLLYHANSFDIRWMERGNENCQWGTTADGKEMIGGDNVYFNNPYWLQYRKTNEARKNRLTGAINLKWDITDWLYAQGAVQRDGYTLEYKEVQPIGAAADPAGFMTEYSKNYYELNTNFLLGFNKTFADKYSVGATFGGNQQRNVTKLYTVTNGGRPFIIEGLWSPNNLGDKRSSKEYIEYRVNSFYGTLDLGYMNQVFLNFTARNDWFSTLSPDNNSYFYPSVTASWIFTDTFDLPDWFNFGKLRASVAAASNGTSAYQNMLLYKVKNFKINGQNVISASKNTYPNPDLKPVKIMEKEVGLNLAFFQNRLNFDMAYYIKDTKDDIAVVSTSKTSGFTSKIMNVGEIRNQGFEFMVDATPVKTSDFLWNTTLNFSYNNSEVKYLGDGVERLAIDGATSRVGGVSVQNVVGSSYGELIGHKYLRDDQGHIVYKDGIAQADSELSSLGNGVYKFTGGWSNSLRYKNVTLSFLFDFKFGAKLFSGTNLSAYSNGLHKNTLAGRTQADPNAMIIGNGVMWDEAAKKYVPNTVGVPASTYYSKLVQNNIAEEFIYDASFIKLRELSLGYQFPKAWMTKIKYVKDINVSLVARNLFNVMKHTDNIDPESAYNTSNGQGLELNGYPATRNIGFNVNIKF